MREPVRPTATKRQVWMGLVALLALGVFLLALPGESAEAAATFTVNKIGDAADRDITNGRCRKVRR